MMAVLVRVLPCLLMGMTSYTEAPAAGASHNVASASTDADARDFVPTPPITVQATSPNGSYVFVVHSPDAWQSKHAVGRLFRNTAVVGQQIEWERALPQEYGPRYFLVGNRGQVVLFDEWINVKSRYAVVLIHKKRNLEVIHDFEAVALILGMPAADITALATHGWWINGTPSLDPTGTHALVATAGKCLAIDLDTGRLSLAHSSHCTISTRETAPTVAPKTPG